MLPLIAWKNVWRNKRRSGIMIAAVALGLWGGLFAVGIFSGMYDSMVNSSIDRDLGHIQVHAKGFREERLLSMMIPDPAKVVRSIGSIPGVQAVTARTIVEGMGSTASSSEGIRIVGIDPRVERDVTGIAWHLVEGTYFDGNERFPVVIGRKLAEKLNLKIRGKLVLSFQRPDGTIVYGAFRVAGIFDTESTTFDGTTIFVRHEDLDGLLGATIIHEIAVRLTTNDSLDTVTGRLATMLPELHVETWQDLAPELKLVAESADITNAIFLGIILLALLFGITNTMLMSVLDRVREFGVLMAVGMKRRRVFSMILMETLFLSLTGGVAGTLLGSLSIAWTGHVGLNLRWVSEGLSQYGISTMLYPVVHTSTYPTLGVMVVVTAAIAAMYPAIKAIRLNPASAIATFG
jgi:ABC-type lipoprotein release transport system permease subunit